MLYSKNISHSNNQEKRKYNAGLNQVAANVNGGDKLVKAALCFPKDQFFNEGFSTIAYADKNIKLSENRFILSDFSLFKMLELASFRADEKVLEIASNIGYSTAIISSLVKEVFAVEDSPSLAKLAHRNMQKMGIHNAYIIEEKLEHGYAEAELFDVIFINGSITHIPSAYHDQLREGGRIICCMHNDASGVMPDGSLLANIYQIIKINGQFNKIEDIAITTFSLF